MKQSLALIFSLVVTFGYTQHSDLEIIERNISSFSEALMEGDTIG